jgi:hypothetical protein
MAKKSKTPEREGADPDHCPCCQARLLYYRQIIAGRGIDPIAVAEAISVWFEDPDPMHPKTRSDAFDAAWKGREGFQDKARAGEIVHDAERLGMCGEELADLKVQVARANAGKRPAPIQRGAA